MKAIVRYLFVAVGCLLILIAVGIVLLTTQIGGLSKRGVERVLTYVFQTETTVDSVAVSPLKQTIELRGLTVANPPEFKKGPAFRFERVEVVLDVESLLTRNPTLRRVVLEGGKINLHYRLGGKTNLSVLAENASRLSKPDAPGAPSGAQRTFTIQELRCEEAKIDLTGSIVPFSKLSLNLAPFTLTDLSKDKPVTAGEVAAVFLRTVVKETITVKGLLKPVSEHLRKELTDLFH